MTDETTGGRNAILSAERLKAFTDAVVAIAMTLLILPLMESIGEMAAEGADAGQWLDENVGPLISFTLSFVVIANFWMGHHRLFDTVDRVTNALVLLTVAWMFTIVWLPVATAMIGQMPDDPVQKSLYIGSMLVTAVVNLGTRVYVFRHPELHGIAAVRLRRGMLADLSTITLFAAALVVAILVPAIGYFAMFLLFLTSPLVRLLDRILPGRELTARGSDRSGRPA